MEETKVKGTEASAPISLEQAREIAAELRAANQERRELLEREERLHAERLLGGTAHAGQQPPAVKEETPKEYKDRIMRGGI